MSGIRKQMADAVVWYIISLSTTFFLLMQMEERAFFWRFFTDQLKINIYFATVIFSENQRIQYKV